jgi:hypothetical protein
LSEYLSDNLGQKTLHQLQGKKDGYKNGKTKISDHPPNNPGPKCRGEILIYIPGQKRYLFPSKNGKIISPPCHSTKIWGKD